MVNRTSNICTIYNLNSNSFERTFLQNSQSSFKASIFIENIQGVSHVVKDYSHANFLLRYTLCRYFVEREIKALIHLQGIEGVPVFYGQYGQFGFCMQYIEGIYPSRQVMWGSKKLIENLETIISQFHERGLTHNDLRVKNMLLDKEGKLYVIDYGAAIIAKNNRFFNSFMGIRFHNILLASDQAKVLKMKLKTPNFILTKQQRKTLISAAKWYRLTDIWKFLRRLYK